MNAATSPKNMHILLSNDDGYFAQGLASLAESLSRHARLSVVAPERNRSGASSSLTLERPLRATRMANGFVKVDGTPTDCVHLAITGLLDREPDMVFAGINHGANLGDDVLYSGTVAAATEGRFLGLPAVAISLASPTSGSGVHFASAAEVASQLVVRLLQQPLPADTVLNVNVPDLPLGEIRGWQATRLGQRHRAEGVIRSTDPRGHELFWIGPAGPEADAGPGTDFHAIREGYVSVTPLRIDLTRADQVGSLAAWLPDTVSVA